MNQHVKYPKDKRSFLERLFDAISPGPDSKPEFFDMLQQAKERKIIDDDGLAMMEGVLQVTELSVADIMVPISQIDLINIDDTIQTVLPFVISKSHSRFPVSNKDGSKVMGILLAKDLLRAHINPKFIWQDYLRPAVCVPESKPLNVLLREFRIKKNHIAIVMDEYSQIAGLVTIEDVIEQIVGDIEDEYDYDQDQDHIVSTHEGTWRVKGITSLTQFNEYFRTDFVDDNIDTIAGFITAYFGRIPHKGEVAIINNIRFEILRTDSRQLHLINIRRTLVGMQ
jgi:magnesium and cobalt transporter